MGAYLLLFVILEIKTKIFLKYAFLNSLKITTTKPLHVNTTNTVMRYSYIFSDKKYSEKSGIPSDVCKSFS